MKQNKPLVYTTERNLGNGLIYKCYTTERLNHKVLYFELVISKQKSDREHGFLKQLPIKYEIPEEKSSSQLIIYSFDKKANKAIQIPSDQFINLVFKNYPLDGKQFLEYVKKWLCYEGKTGTYKEKGHNHTYAEIDFYINTLPPIMFGVGLGINQASKLMQDNYGDRINVKLDNLIGTSYVSEFNEDYITYDIKNHDVDLELSDKYIDLSGYTKNIDILNIKLPIIINDSNLKFKNADKYKNESKDIKQIIDNTIIKCRPELDNILKELQILHKKELGLINSLVVNKSVPATYELATASEKKIIENLYLVKDKIDDLEYKLQNIKFTKLIEYLNDYYIYNTKEDRCEYSNEIPQKFKLAIGAIKPEKSKKEIVKKSTKEINTDIEKLIDKAIPALLKNSINQFLDLNTYIKDKYQIDSIKNLPKEQIAALKKDIKQDLEKAIEDGANKIYNKIHKYQRKIDNYSYTNKSENLIDDIKSRIKTYIKTNTKSKGE